MSDALAEAVARVWPDGRSTWEALGGGITNHNVKVTRPDGVVVLRVAGKDTDLLGIDRTVELAATRAAAEVGVGPEVVDFVEPEGWLVTRFVLTNFRLLRYWSPLALRVESLRLSAIESLSVRQGVWGRILGYGDVIADSTATQGGRIVLDAVTDPQGLRDRIAAALARRVES